MKCLTREIKAEMWKLFDAGHNFENLNVGGMKIPSEAIAKQRELWSDYRTRIRNQNESRRTQS